MTAAARLAGFAVVLATALGGGAALGAAVGPINDDPAPAPHDGGSHEPVPGPGATTADPTSTTVHPHAPAGEEGS
jgi:hypothetical protein